MRSFALLSLFGLVSSEFGVEKFVINGAEIDISKYNFAVSLLRKVEDNFVSFCSGGLIGPNLVVTAASCISSVEAKDIIVGFDVTDASKAKSTSSYRRVSGSAIHESYSASKADDDILPLRIVFPANNDFAVLHLESPVPMKKRTLLKLPENSLGAGDVVTALGFGTLMPVHPSVLAGGPSLLQKMSGKVVNQRVCGLAMQDEQLYQDLVSLDPRDDFFHKREDEAHEKLSGNMSEKIAFCFVGDSSDSALYFGDSGGPVFVRSGDTYVLQGVNSFLTKASAVNYAADVRRGVDFFLKQQSLAEEALRRGTPERSTHQTTPQNEAKVLSAAIDEVVTRTPWELKDWWMEKFRKHMPDFRSYDEHRTPPAALNEKIGVEVLPDGSKEYDLKGMLPEGHSNTKVSLPPMKPSISAWCSTVFEWALLDLFELLEKARNGIDSPLPDNLGQSARYFLHVSGFWVETVSDSEKLDELLSAHSSSVLPPSLSLSQIPSPSSVSLSPSLPFSAHEISLQKTESVTNNLMLELLRTFANVIQSRNLLFIRSHVAATFEQRYPGAFERDGSNVWFILSIVGGVLLGVAGIFGLCKCCKKKKANSGKNESVHVV